MGYSTISGSSRRALATLKTFGLLDAKGEGSVAVSRDLQALKLAPDEDTRRYHLLSFLSRSELYAALLARYPPAQ
jgi:hypothetical protein